MSSIPSKKRVFIFTSVHPWNDVRIFHKQACSLSKEFEVELHAPANFNRKVEGGVTIFGLPIWTSKISRIKTISILCWRTLKSKADIFHFHDPELILVGLLIKYFKGKSVIYDIHENTRQLILERSWIPWVFRKPLHYLLSFLERTSMSNFDKIILAEDSYCKFISTNAMVIHNYPLWQRIEEVPKTIDVVYVGGVLKERGAFEMLRIANQIKLTVPNFIMKIIGPIAESLHHEMSKYLQDNDLINNVILSGRLAYPTAMEEIARSKVGIAILHPIRNYTESLPTKLFEYMRFGLPYVASDFPYWKTLFENEHAGYHLRYDNIELAAEKISDLLENENLRDEYGSRGSELAKTKFSWSSEEANLFNVYNEIARK